jgi:hypothetical protein
MRAGCRPYLLQQLLLLVCNCQLLCQRHNLRLPLCQFRLVLLQSHLQLACNLRKQAAAATAPAAANVSNQ